MQGSLAVRAIACDRCGAVQLFDPSARSHPEAPFPPRRVARLRPAVSQPSLVDDQLAENDGCALDDASGQPAEIDVAPDALQLDDRPPPPEVAVAVDDGPPHP